MPPMPLPPGIAWPFFCGTSATIASVVMSRPATDAAPCSAARTTLVRVDDAMGYQVAVLHRLQYAVSHDGMLWKMEKDQMLKRHNARVESRLLSLPRDISAKC